ncbi:MAG: ABC transporter permease subunit, partial [Desulfurococcaceae archaeon]
MRSYRNLRALLWKEVKEICRDKKLILTTIFFPLISLPAIGMLTAILMQFQPVVISIVNEDYQSSELSTLILSKMTTYLANQGYIVLNQEDVATALGNFTIDLIVVIPREFSANLTSFDRVAYIELIKRTGVPEDRLNKAEQDVRGLIETLSDQISELKIEEIAIRSGLTNYSLHAIRSPLQVKAPIYISPSGEQAKPEDIIRPFIAKLLILSLSFIVTPASSFIVDSIVGERERKTMEMLLATPVSVWEIFASKVIAASIIGSVASLADIGSLLVYFGTLITALGSRFVALFDINLIILHALVGFLTILVTVSISIPFISRTRGIRTASNIASLFSVIGLAFFVSGWIID